MHQAIEAAAQAVEKSRRELESRIGELRFLNPVQKMQHAPLITAAIYELFDHQARFNQCAIAEISTLESRVAELEGITRAIAGVPVRPTAES